MTRRSVPKAASKGAVETVGRQARELHRLRDELRAAQSRIEQFRKIDEVAHWLAAIRVRRDQRFPRVLHERFESAPRFASHQAAYAEILDRADGLIDDVREDVEELLEDRRKMLDALGMDEFDWQRVAWRL